MEDNRLTEKNGHRTRELNESRFSVRHSVTHPHRSVYSSKPEPRSPVTGTVYLGAKSVAGN